MNFLKHAYQQPLIFATGLAALVHSTWALGTMFSGTQPAVESITNEIGWIHFAGWIVPALLIAFALDIGQIVTSHEIRTRGMTKARAATFITFALATYYLQWLYMAHHMPLIPLAPGISSIHLDAALFLRNFALWLIPALLPLSTLLYTFSSETDEIATIELPPIAIREVKPDVPKIEDGNSEFAELTEGLQHVATCPECGWQCEPKDSELSATRALSAHKIHCTAQHVRFSKNGVSNDHS